MELAQYLEAAAYDTAFWMAGTHDDEYPVDELGALSKEVCAKLRAMAIFVLLAKGDSDAFLHNLVRSGRLRLRYLKRMRAEGLESDHDFCAGRYAALADALASGDIDLAREIDQLSPPGWRKGHEYFDDNSCGRLLGMFAHGRYSEAECATQLQEWRDWLGKDADPRLGVAAALHSGKQEEFDESFEELLEGRDLEIAADKARGQLEEPHVVAGRLVYVEGLAWLRLAEQRGLELAPEYRFCPALARLPMQTPFPGE